MKEAIEFIQDFIRKEYAAYQACYLERERKVFKEAQRAVGLMYAGDLRTQVQRGIEPEEEWFTEGEKKIQEIKERLLFQIREYEHQEYGSLWGCYVSDPHGWTSIRDGIESPPYWSDSYSCILYVAYITSPVTSEKNLYIIAEYNFTSKKYIYGSLLLEPLGNTVAILQFQPPKDEESRVEYEKDSRLAVQLSASVKKLQESKKGPEEVEKKPEKVAESHTPSAQLSFKASSPGQEEFIRIFGALEEKILWEAEDYRICLKLLGGRFYTHGFFPDGSDPYRANLPWEDIIAATKFLNEVTDILKEGGCTSLGSAGDRRYYPFLCRDEKLAYLPSFVNKISTNLPGTDFKSYMRTERSCIFWGKGEEAMLKEYLDAKTIKAFKQAGKMLKEKLKGRGELDIVQTPYSIEYPLILGGTFATGLFAGVFTTRI